MNDTKKENNEVDVNNDIESKESELKQKMVSSMNELSNSATNGEMISHMSFTLSMKNGKSIVQTVLLGEGERIVNSILTVIDDNPHIYKLLEIAMSKYHLTMINKPPESDEQINR
jgi:hypothetical protein